MNNPNINNDYESNEKIFKIEKRIEVRKEIKIREIDKCVISIVSRNSSGKTFLSWNLEKIFNDNDYNTAIICIDDNNSAKYIYGIDSEKEINLNNINKCNIKDLATKLSNNRTIYTNTDSETIIKLDNISKIIDKCKNQHEIIIIDTGSNSSTTNKAISLSDKVIIIFDLIEYNIDNNLILLNTIMHTMNNKDIIIVINNYVQCNISKYLVDILKKQQIDNIIFISNISGEDIYDLIGTSNTPIDKNNIFKNQIKDLLKCLKGRNNAKNLKILKYLKNNIKTFCIACKKYIENKTNVKFLKFTIFLFFILFIITILNIKNFNIDFIKNYFGGK